jgi:XTP/dITP diphosphohydrolase
MRLLIATTNQGKIKEISSLLQGLDLELLTPQDIHLDLVVEETGATYLENARLKVLAYSQAAGLPTLADDTGLEVAALAGQPGLHSARFIPDPRATDRDRRALLLEKLAPYPRPWQARFICVAALALPGQDLIFKEGICPGEIIPQERGRHGFGYDAIFLVAGTHHTMAELELSHKNHISHRAQAIRALYPYLPASG